MRILNLNKWYKCIPNKSIIHTVNYFKLIKIDGNKLYFNSYINIENEYIISSYKEGYLGYDDFKIEEIDLSLIVDYLSDKHVDKINYYRKKKTDFLLKLGKLPVPVLFTIKQNVPFETFCDILIDNLELVHYNEYIKNNLKCYKSNNDYKEYVNYINIDMLSCEG